MKFVNAFFIFIGTCLVVGSPVTLTAEPGKPNQILVQPSSLSDAYEKAQEDWTRISDALSSVDPGGTVQLSPGTFFLDRSIVIEGYDGTLKGAGRNRTTVRTAPDIIFDVSSNPVLAYVDGFQTKQHAMFLFLQPLDTVERSVSIKDLAIVTDQPSSGWFRGYPSDLEEGLNSVGGVAVVNQELSNEQVINLNVEFRDLTVRGIQGDAFRGANGTNYSCASALITNGAADGQVIVDNVHVEGATIGAGLFVWVGAESHTAVIDSVFENTFIGIYADGWSNLTIAGNRIVNNQRVGASLWNSPVYLPAGFESTSGWVANNVFDRGGRINLFLDRGNDLIIADNVFRETEPVVASVLAVRQSRSILRDNRFVDTGGGAGPNFLVAASDKVFIRDNNHKASGQSGWVGDPLNGICQEGPGAIRVAGSSDTTIRDERFPGSSSIEDMLCDQGTGTEY